MTSMFDPIADTYDRWYDTPEGSAIFHEEVECLRLVCDNFSGCWLELGSAPVGSQKLSASPMASTFHLKWRLRLRDEEYEYALDALNNCLSQSSCLTTYSWR